MTKSEITGAYKSLTRNVQIELLSRVAHALTIEGRGTYVTGTEDVADGRRLRSFNELLHRITGQLASMIEENPRRYPDDVFAEILWESMSELKCEKNLVQTLQSLTKPLKQTA